MAVAVLYCVGKSGFYNDEFYSFGLSNSTKGAFIDQIKRGDASGATLYTWQDYHEYLTVQKDEGLDSYESVFTNQALDVHPPLYYLLLHTICLLVPDVFSKWVGLVPNLAMHLIVLLQIYRLSRSIHGNTCLALVSVVLYGLSPIAMSNLLLIRMYMLETVLTLALAQLLWDLRGQWSMKRCVLIGVTIACGLLCQYYYVFFAFFACLALDVFFLSRRAVREAAVFSAIAIGGVLLFVLVWPFIFSQLSQGDGGPFAIHALEVLASPGDALSALVYMTMNLVGESPVSVLVLMTGLVAALVCRFSGEWGNLTCEERERMSRVNDALVLMGEPAVITYVVVACIQLLGYTRYVYNVAPLLIAILPVCVCALALPLGRRFRNRARKMTFGALASLLIVSLALIGPTRLYYHPAYVDMRDEIQKYAAHPCVITQLGRRYRSLLTDSMGLMMQFNDTLCVTVDDYRSVGPYARDHERNEKLVLLTTYEATTLEMSIGSLAEDAAFVAGLASEAGYRTCTPIMHREQTCLWILSDRMDAGASDEEATSNTFRLANP